jgi:prolyl-tRNA editing enzyme YbaK/EbsC (Cys-tRNA(Pro) deacylase)
MPPVGFAQRVFVDKSLVGEPEMVLSAGSHTEAIRMHYADWAEVVHPVIGVLCETKRSSEAN